MTNLSGKWSLKNFGKPKGASLSKSSKKRNVKRKFLLFREEMLGEKRKKETRFKEWKISV